MLKDYLNNRRNIVRSLFIVLILMSGAMALVAQTKPKATPAPTPAPKVEDEALYNGYKVSGSFELGYRWSKVSGNADAFRSQLNYKTGFRSFDGSFLLESVTGKGKYFDSLLVTNTGWGADPIGSTRVNMEKTGYYNFKANVQKVNYFNEVQYFVAVPTPYQHSQQTKNTMGDFDLTILPQNKVIRVTVGASFGDYKGPGTMTERESGDEFVAGAKWNERTNDYRLGFEGTFLGFDWGLTEGYREYKDLSSYHIDSTNLGNAITGTTLETLYSKFFPTTGDTSFTQFNIHRTIAKKLDFTGRAIYSTLKSYNNLTENHVGRDASNNFIDQDLYTSIGSAKRPQTRTDLGVTYNVTDAFRISETFTFDQFNVNTNNFYTQDLLRRNAAGVALAPTSARSKAFRTEGLRRFLNTFEGDYQVNNRISFHLGWRYSKRRVQESGFDLNVVTGAYSTAPFADQATNSTNALIAGMKIKPVKAWTIYWDLEHGQADNVFSKLENYNYTNYRVRSRYGYKNFTLNLSGIVKNNSNPSLTLTTLPATLNYVTNIKSRLFDAAMTWDATNKVSVSGGYSYRQLTSYTPVIFPYQQCTTVACTAGTSVNQFTFSEYYSRDHYGYVELAVKPTQRVSFYAAFRMDKDLGQGDRVAQILPNTFPVPGTGVVVYASILGGYPMSFLSPEVKAVIRIRKNIDWNVGYQYYKFTDVKLPVQNYKTSLPYTSLRIYFGHKAEDR